MVLVKIYFIDLDLKTYNEVIKLTSESAFKSIFGYWTIKINRN